MCLGVQVAAEVGGLDIRIVKQIGDRGFYPSIGPLFVLDTQLCCHAFPWCLKDGREQLSVRLLVV